MRRLIVVAVSLLAVAAFGSPASAASLSSEASFRATLVGDVSGGATLVLRRDGGGTLSVKAYNVNPQTVATAGLSIGTCDVESRAFISFKLSAASVDGLATVTRSLSAAQVSAVRSAIAANRPMSLRVLAVGGTTGCGDLAGHPEVGTARLAGSVPGVGARYDIRYPVVSGIGDAAGPINTVLTADARATAAGFSADAADAGRPSSGAGPSTGAQTFSVSLSRPTLLSIGALFSEYRTGAAHPISTLSTWTFDLVTGRQLRLTDILRPGYLSVLSAESRTRLRSLLGSNTTTSLINSGTTPSAANFSWWQLEAGGLRITFSEFSVGPHSVGLPSIVIPWANLRSVINFNSPVAFLVPPGACTAGQLAAQMSIWEGGVGSRFNTIRVVNRSSVSCFLQGTPQSRLVDGAGHVLLSSGPAHVSTGDPRITLAAGGAATILVITNNYCGPAATNRVRVVLGLPGGTGAVSGIPAAGASTADDLPPCNGPTAAHVITTNGWRHAA